jgi:aminoglycoside 6-adenylyltransferase
VQRAYDELTGRIIAWAEGDPNVRAVVVIGSRARSHDHPADDWSDLDLLVFCRDPEPLWQSTGWLDRLGDVWTSFLEPTPAGGFERRALFAPGLDVDCVLSSAAGLEEMLAGAFPPDVEDMLRRGHRFIVDKDQYEAGMALPEAQAPAWRPPAAPEFLNLVNDFWFHTVWTAKKLRRGELWTAKSCCDNYLKNLLCRMIEWHARLTGPAGKDTWMGGRFLDEWADPQTRAALPETFARYDGADVWRALFATRDLFRRLSRETAQKLGIAYPDRADEETTRLVGKL